MIEIGEQRMRPDLKNQSTLLGYLGLIPFMLAAFLIWVRPPSLSYFTEQYIYATLIYGALILSFMGGARWGAAIQTGDSDRLLPAVIPALIAWVAAMPGGVISFYNPVYSFRFLILMAAFIGLFVQEIAARDWAPWYSGLRLRLSLGVSGLILLMILGLNY